MRFSDAAVGAQDGGFLRFENVSLVAMRSITQTNDRQAVTIVNRHAYRLASNLRRAVKIAIVKRMRLGHRHFHGVTVNRCGTGIDQLLHFVLYTGLQNVVRACDVDFECRSRER